jgi:hypothetical protein
MPVSICGQEFVRPPNPSARHLRCFAHLDTDIETILPHLNTVWFRVAPGGGEARSFRVGGGKHWLY